MTPAGDPLAIGADARESSEAVEDYVRAILRTARGPRRVASTTEVAECLGVTPASVSGMFKKLARLELVVYVPYRGVSLTRTGMQLALRVTRRRRLLEAFLAETLGMPLDHVHDEADRLEHALSEELEARIDASLGHPTSDPHGDPIPGPDLQLDSPRVTALADLREGDQRRVRRVPDGDGELLRYLSSLRLVPGSRVEVRRAAPFGGPLTVSVEGNEHAISRELAASIGVA